MARDCPISTFQQEIPGKTGSSPSARTAALTASPAVSELTEEQLQELLTERRLRRESQLLHQASSTRSAEVDVITAGDCATGTVGPSLYLDLLIEGVQVNALSTGICTAG